jgi:hypothetical protein
MAINWLLALKAVPWTDLAQATPALVKGARKLFAGVRAGHAGTSPQPQAKPAGPADASIDSRLNEVENALGALGAEQRTTAELIRSLAEQNARVVESMAIMQARLRILFGLCIALAVGLAVLAVWLATR